MFGADCLSIGLSAIRWVFCSYPAPPSRVPNAVVRILSPLLKDKTDLTVVASCSGLLGFPGKPSTLSPQAVSA